METDIDKLQIFEDKYQQKAEGEFPFADLMTDEQRKRAGFYLQQYSLLRAEMDKYADTWGDISKLYQGEREETADPNANNYVNVVQPNIEGQVASLTNNVITAHFRGVGKGDDNFAATADIISRAIFKHNRIKQKVKRLARRYLLFGNAPLIISWDDKALDGYGMPRYNTVKLNQVLFSPNVSDKDDINDADYIIEIVGEKSIMWAREKWGDEVADALQIDNPTEEFSSDTKDDRNTFTYLKVWTKNNPQGNLQLIELSLNGLLINESDPSEPYYKYVENRYPIFWAGLYPQEDSFYSFGDGKAIKPVQEIINKLYDEIILAVKFSSQGRTYADPTAKVNPDEFAKADPREVIYAKNPQSTLRTERGVGLNQVVFSLMEQLFQKVQEITRFSALMTGNHPGSGMTATQAGIQMQQGNAGIDDKRTDISHLIEESIKYALGLCMEFWSAAKAFRVADNEDKFEWVDARQMSKAPVMVPATKEYRKKWRRQNPEAKETPKFMQLEVKDEETRELKAATKTVEFDIEVSVGEGLPTNKLALYNIVLSLAQIQLPDEMGQPRSLMSFKQVRDMAEQILGLNLADPEEQEAPPPPDPQIRDGMGQGNRQQQIEQILNQDPNVPGADAQGRPGMSRQAPVTDIAEPSARPGGRSR